MLFGFEDLLPLPQSDAGSTPSDAGSDAECPVGFDDCDDRPGCETVVSGSDPNNCGACKRTCGGGTCSAGACSPEIIATDDDALAIATDGTYVYWSTQAVDAGADAEPASEIIRTTRDGGAGNSVVASASSLSGTGTFTVDDANVYWTTKTWKVVLAPKGGGASRSFDLSPEGGIPYRVTVANNAAFVSVRQANNGDGRIDAVPLTGAPAVTLVTGQNQPAGVVASPTHVFWVNSGTNRVGQVQVDGGGSLTISSNGVSPQYLATDGTRLYWTHASAGGGVWAAPLPLTASTAAVQLYRGDGIQGRGIAVDGTHVYWSTAAGIDRVKKDGTKHVSLVNLNADAVTREIAIDDAWVYFLISTPPPARIARTPK